MKRRGCAVEPKSKEFEKILIGFSEALFGRGSPRWQAYFIESTCEDIVHYTISDLHDTSSENRKDSRPDWMKQADQWSKNLTQEKWQKTLNSQMAKEQDRCNDKLKEKPPVFDFNDVSGFFNWEGRPAVTALPSDGLLEGWYLSDPDSNWARVSPLEIRDSGRSLSSEDFHEVFADRLSEASKTSQKNWMDKIHQALDVTPEEWQETIDARYADEVDKHRKMLEPKIKQIKHDFDWDEVYGFCVYKGAPALQFRTKNDPYNKETTYTLHGRYLKISEDGVYWEVIRTILPLIGKSMSKDEFIKFSDDYIG